MATGEQQIVEPRQLVRWQLQAQRIECCPAGSRTAGRAEARAVRKANREIGQLKPLRAAVAGQHVAIAVDKANIIRHLHRWAPPALAPLQYRGQSDTCVIRHLYEFVARSARYAGLVFLKMTAKCDHLPRFSSRLSVQSGLRGFLASAEEVLGIRV